MISQPTRYVSRRDSKQVSRYSSCVRATPPLLHSLLFAFYHIWTPWMFVTRTLGMLPLVFAVQRRNLNLSIIVHILTNSLDVFAAFGFILGMSSIA
jgi:hypothetical protein